jgi:hypothetical protein
MWGYQLPPQIFLKFKYANFLRTNLFTSWKFKFRETTYMELDN